MKGRDGMIQTRVALLRAVNVGGTGGLPMADLHLIAQAVGLTDVRTYIQSGNLVVSTPDDPAAVKAALEDRLKAYVGRPVGVVIRTADEMRAVLHANPFPQADPSGLSGTKESELGFPFWAGRASHEDAHRNIFHRLR